MFNIYFFKSLSVYNQFHNVFKQVVEVREDKIRGTNFPGQLGKLNCLE